MKQLTHLIIIAIILTNCSNAQIKSIDNKITQTDNSKKTILSSLKGVWVSTDYINEISKTKSPLKSSNKLKGVVTMIIDRHQVGDSLEIGISINNHEGGSFFAFLSPGQNSSSLKTNLPDYNESSNFYELGFENINNESVLFLYHFDKAKKLLDKRQFTKVAESQKDDDAAWGLQYIVNKIMFSGHYIFYDKGVQTNVEFKNDGSSIGLKDFKKYVVATDFVAEGPDEESFDAISFSNSKSVGTVFLFEFNSDTLILINGKDTIKLTRKH